MPTINDVTLQQLGESIASAIQRSGGASRGYNPISNQVAKDSESPARRAEAVRTYKISQDNNQIMKELAKQHASSTRSIAQLERMMDINNKTLSKAINSYETVEEVEKELVQNLKKQIEAHRITAAELKSLGGEVKGLEGALKFADMAKATAELSKALKETAKGEQAAVKMLNALDSLQAQSENNTLGSNFQYLKDEIVQAFKDNNTKYNEITKKVTKSNGTDLTDIEYEQLMKNVNKQLEAHIKSGRLLIFAQDIDTLALKSHTASVEANIQTQEKLETVGETLRKRMTDWSVNVGTAANVIARLSIAAQHLYKTMQAAAATGTQRTVGDVIAREKSALFNFVDVETVQEVQSKNARNRTAMGRSSYDRAMYTGASDMYKLTGNKDTSMKEFATSVNLMSNAGIGQKEAIKATTSLIGTFNELQYITGMTVGEINSMNAELTAGADFKQSMVGLDEQQRSVTIKNMDLMIKENALRGISIDQSKAMIQAQKDISNPFSPRARMKAKVQMQVMGSVLGIDMTDAADMVGMGKAKFRDKLKSQGLSEKDIDKRVADAEGSMERAGTINSQKLANGDIGTEMVGSKLDHMKPFYDGRFDQSGNNANAATGNARKEYDTGTKDSLASGISGAGMAATGAATHLWDNPWVKLGLAVGGAKAVRLGASKLRGAWSAPGGAGRPPAPPGGRLAGRAGVGAGGMLVGMLGGAALDYAGDKLDENGNTQWGAAAKIGASAASWAGTGAMLGLAVPGIGSAVGATVGGIAGTAYGAYNNWGALTGSKSPTVSPNVNTDVVNSTQVSSSSTGGTPGSTTSTDYTKQDPTIALNMSTAQMVQILGSILQVLTTQTDQMVAGNDKSVEMQQKLNRTMKQSGFSATTIPAVATIA